MIHYPHFALPNLYLLNGYQQHKHAEGETRSYEREDELELCVARVLLRKPRRLRGWDARFLRRAVGLSQAEFGTRIGRTEQSVARWEKSDGEVPVFVDLAARTEFAAKFESTMTVLELAKLVRCEAPSLPTRIFLRLFDAGWTYEFAHVAYATQSSTSIALASERMPASHTILHLASQRFEDLGAASEHETALSEAFEYAASAFVSTTEKVNEEI